MATTRVALALGSGGARGYAHIGVIRELQRRNMEVAAISGASMGALIGGLVATDRLEDYATRVSGLRRSDVLRRREGE
ncbi:MAG: patatin-like phospholipase family protein [Nocardioides sp.]|uniref:patatin-like phospholipase family protein n=1 Tax=Nocardioides sp. TaxID=35761 RepID=UPI0039E43A2A